MLSSVLCRIFCLAVLYLKNIKIKTHDYNFSCGVTGVKLGLSR